jgi:hypothetical protein
VWVSDTGSACPFLNNATLLGSLEGHYLPRLTARLDGLLAARSGGPSLLWSGRATPALETLSYSFWGEPPLMLRPPSGTAPPRPQGLRIVRARDAPSVEAFERVLLGGFPLPWLQPAHPG